MARLGRSIAVERGAHATEEQPNYTGKPFPAYLSGYFLYNTHGTDDGSSGRKRLFVLVHPFRTSSSMHQHSEVPRAKVHPRSTAAWLTEYTASMNRSTTMCRCASKLSCLISLDL